MCRHSNLHMQGYLGSTVGKMRTNQSSCNGSPSCQNQQQYDGRDGPGETKRALGSRFHTHNGFSRKHCLRRVASTLKRDRLGKGFTELTGNLKTLLRSFGKDRKSTRLNSSHVRI